MKNYMRGVPRSEEQFVGISINVTRQGRVATWSTDCESCGRLGDGVNKSSQKDLAMEHAKVHDGRVRIRIPV